MTSANNDIVTNRKTTTRSTQNKVPRRRGKGDKAEKFTMLRRNKSVTMAKCDREPVTGGTVLNWIDGNIKKWRVSCLSIDT